MTLLLIALTLLTPEERDSLLADTPGNSAFWTEALASYRGEVLEAVEYLFAGIPRLDRLEMTSEALMDHVIGAIDSRDEWYDSIPHEVFLEGLVGYRMDEEPVTAYRTPLFTHWHQRLGEADTTVSAVAERLAWSISAMRVRQPDFMGGMPSPRDVLASGGGTPAELRLLLGCSLRAMGIPVRSVYGWFQGVAGRETGWLEYWTGEGWRAVTLPSDSVPEGFAGLSLAVAGDEYVTSAMVPTGVVALEPVDGAVESFLVAFSIPARGRLIPLDWLDVSPAAPCTVEVGAGSYYLHLSRRLPDGGVRFASIPFEIAASDTVGMNLETIAGALR